MTLYSLRWFYAVLMSTIILIAGYFFDLGPMMQQLQVLEEKKNILHDQNRPKNTLTASPLPLLPQKSINQKVMQTIQASGIRIHAISKTDDNVFHLVLDGSYESLYQFIMSLPRTVWLKNFHIKTEKNELRVTLAVLFMQSDIALKISNEPRHNPFCLPRLIVSMSL